MSHYDVVKQVRELLASADTWTKQAPARRADGSLTHFFDPQACRFCLTGAINRVLFPVEPTVDHTWRDRAWEIKQTLAAALRRRDPERYRWCANPPTVLVTFNDGPETTHTDVLCFLDECLQAE